MRNYHDKNISIELPDKGRWEANEKDASYGLLISRRLSVTIFVSSIEMLSGTFQTMWLAPVPHAQRRKTRHESIEFAGKKGAAIVWDALDKSGKLLGQSMDFLVFTSSRAVLIRVSCDVPAKFEDAISIVRSLAVHDHS